jgi:hypothetical protein
VVLVVVRLAHAFVRPLRRPACATLVLVRLHIGTQQIRWPTCATKYAASSLCCLIPVKAAIRASTVWYIGSALACLCFDIVIRSMYAIFLSVALACVSATSCNPNAASASTSACDHRACVSRDGNRGGNQRQFRTSLRNCS